MSRKGVIITEGTPGPNVAGKPFQTSALLTTGVAIAGKLSLGTVYALTSVDDAKALGLNADYDTTNNVVVFEHISEFYRLASAGTTLYILIAPQTVLLGALIDDTAAIYAKKLVIAAKGDIFNLAIGFNPLSTYTEEAVDGLNADVRTAFVKAQALHQWTDDTFRPVQILLEGRGYAAPAATALNLRAIPDGPDDAIFEADRVSLVVGQDWDFADTLTGLAQKHAAIGTALGVLGNIEINQNIGEVATQNLSDATKRKWMTAGLSNHIKCEDQEADLDTLDTKGYIFADDYVGITGYRWNTDPTCTPIIVDADGNMNAHTIGYGRTLDFTKRNLRAALLPTVNTVKPVDTTTGKLPTGIIKDLEKKGDDVFDDMAASGWLSGGAMYVDANSDVLVAKVLNVSFDLVPEGTIGQINGTIQLKIRK